MRNFCRSLLWVLTLVVPAPSFAQVSPNAFVPCQEMPDLMEHYNADQRAIGRFYANNLPDKRARLEALDHEYLGKLKQLDFNSLPQECKVDYILFKRDLDQRLVQSADEAFQYKKIKAYFPFADSIYAIEKLRRRGHQLNSELLAKRFNTRR